MKADILKRTVFCLLLSLLASFSPAAGGRAYRLSVVVEKDDAFALAWPVELSVDFNALSMANIIPESIRVHDKDGLEIPCQSDNWQDGAWQKDYVAGDIYFTSHFKGNEKQAAYFLCFNILNPEDEKKYKTDLKADQSSVSVDNEFLQVTFLEDGRLEVANKAGGKRVTLRRDAFRVTGADISILSRGFTTVGPVRVVYRMKLLARGNPMEMKFIFNSGVPFFRVESGGKIYTVSREGLVAEEYIPPKVSLGKLEKTAAGN